MKDKNNIDLNPEELKIILNPMKLVYVNNIWNNGVEHRLYVKSSSFPLFKQLTRGLELDKLRLQMEKQKIDRVAFESAVKLGGTLTPTQIFEDTNEEKTNLGKIKDKFKIQIIGTVPREGLKKQQDMPFKEDSTTINDGTQQRKLLTSEVRGIEGFNLRHNTSISYTGQDIQDLMDDNYNELFKIKYDALIKELDFNIEDGTINMTQLQKVLVDEALTRGYPLYDIEALKLKQNENGELKFIIPLWLTGVSGKIESMLNSIVDNRVRKLKPKGKSYILGTSAGFSPIVEGDMATEFMANTSGIIYDAEFASRQHKELLPMRIEDANGNIKGSSNFDASTATVKPAEILVPFKFKDSEGNMLNIKDFTTNGMIDISKLSPELLELFGFRIPTQGLNSMAYIKIVGFLPSASGDLLIAPADWTVQMGSDFDIDKIYTNSFNTSYVEGKLVKYNETDRSLQLENEILDLHIAILSNKDERVQSKIMSPLGFGKLKEVIDTIYPLTKSITEGISISEEYQTRKYRNARAGKTGVAIFSNDSTFLAVIQGKKIYLQRKAQKGYIPYHFSLGGQRSNEMSNPMTNTGNRSKADVIKGLQSLAVDNENEQGLHKLNINKYTFDVIRTLALAGFEEDTMFYYLNQPIIRKYVELKALAEDTVTPYTEGKMWEELKALYPMSEDASNMDANTLFTTFANPSKAQLLSMLAGENVSGDTQRVLLYRFLELEEFGKRIQTVQSTINADSAGLGKDLFYSNEKAKQVRNLKTNKVVANSSNLIGEYVDLVSANFDENSKEFSGLSDNLRTLAEEWGKTNLTLERKKEIIEEFKNEGYIPVTTLIKKGITQNKMSFIKPSTINGFATVYGLLLNNTIWEQFFPYDRRGIQNVTDAIKVLTGKEGDTIQETADINRTIFSNIKSFIATKNTELYVDGTIESERERLLIDTPTNKSIASIVKHLRDNNLLNNVFINRLEFDIFKGLLPSTVKYRAAVAENVNERAIYASLAQMLTDDATVLGMYNEIEYTPKKVAQDLIAQQLLTGGVQKATQFIKYIPINYLKTIGYYNALDGIEFNNENDFNDIYFQNQYVQHNPKSIELKKGVPLNAFKFYNDKTIIRKTKEGQDDLPFMFSIPNPLAITGYSLYVYDNFSNQWEQKDTLGKGDTLEYNAKEEFGTSVMPNNKVPEVTVIDLPTNPTETTKVLETRGESKDDNVISDPTTKTITEKFGLNKEGTSLEKFGNMLETIIHDSPNKLHSYLAQELYNNIEKLKGYKLIINNNLPAKGSYVLKGKTIQFNPTVHTSPEAFEQTVLEEIIHAYTKEALMANEHGEVNRLKGFRSIAIQTVKNYLGDTADAQFAEVERKMAERLPLTQTEADLIYPVMNDMEFVGRLFKSKKLQELLNEIQSDTKGESIWDKIKQFITELLNSMGLDIKEGSVLQYALTDTISLINVPAPSSDIKGELKKKNKVVRTPEFIRDKFKLQDKNGNNKTFTNAQEIANWVNDNVSNLIATVVNNTVIIQNNYKEILGNDYVEGQQLDLFGEGNKEDAIQIYNKLGNKTKSGNIVIQGVYQQKGIQYAASIGGVFSLRVDNSEKHFGNPFSNVPAEIAKGLIATKSTRESVEKFTDWVINSQDERAKWIREQLKSGNLKGKPIVYYKELGQPSHATALDYLINKYDWTKDDTDLAPTIAKAAPLLKSINNRISHLKANIEKAEKAEDFQHVAELKEVLENLIERRDGIDTENSISVMAINTLADVSTKGVQDMQELEAMFKRKVTLEDTLYMRKVIHFWRTAKDKMFGEDELQSPVLLKKFSDVSDTAAIFDNKLTAIENEYMENFMKKYGSTMTVKDIFTHFKDINGLQRDYTDISRVNNPLLDSVFLAVKDANVDAHDEVSTLLEGLGDLENKIRPILKQMGHDELYDIFRQRNKNGKLTGHLVNRFTERYRKDRRDVLQKARDMNNSTTYTNLVTWSKNNTVPIELNYLFPVSKLTSELQAKADKYKEALKAQLGDVHYNLFIEAQSELIERYNKHKEGKVEALITKYNLNSREEVSTDIGAKKEYANWLQTNSPYSFNNHIKNGVPASLDNFRYFNSFNYVYQIPSKEESYDSNFKIIENNKDLLEFYNYYTKVDKELKQLLPIDTRVQLAFNGIPFVQKLLLDEYKDKGMKVGLVPIWDGIKKSTRTNVEGKISYKTIDPVTEEEEKRLGVVLTKNNTEEYLAYVRTKSIQYRQETGNEPTASQITEWGEEITDTLAQQKSYDLPKVLKVYALTVLAYKHKAKIEDSIKLAQNILHQQRELERNNLGEIQTDDIRKLPIEKNEATSFLNTKLQVDYFIKNFYGENKQEEGVTNTKVYTKEEKEKLVEYTALLATNEQQYADNKIDEGTYNSTKETLELQIEDLGGVAVWSKRGDAVLKYVQLKSMGWNMMSAIANMGFGYIANRIEAAGGQLYNMEELNKAYSLVSNSILRNASFNRYTNETAFKIRTMMDKWDVLHDASTELFDNPLTLDGGKSTKWLAPYNLTKRTEYINQAPIMIAMMLHMKIETPNGKVSMWEAFDVDGQWKTEYGEEPKALIKQLRHRIDQTVKMNHGNYDPISGLRVKDTFMGRALSQFRTWMFEGVAVRFEGEKEDKVLGITRKGRYVSMKDFYSNVGFSQGVLATIKGFLRSASFGVIFKGMDFENFSTNSNLKEVDIANMRKMMVELSMLVGVATTYAMLSLLAAGLDDEDDKNKKLALNMLINQGIRLKTDILFYLDPREFKSLLRDIVPAASVIKDTFEFMDAIYDFAIGEDEIKTGVYSGNSKLLRESAQMLPFTTQIYKNINYSIQTFD